MMSLKKYMLRHMSATVIGVTLLLFCGWFLNEYVSFHYRNQDLRQHFTDTRKQLLKSNVLRVVEYINHMEGQIETRLKEIIRSRVEEAHAVASHLYEINRQTHSPEEIAALIREALRPVRFSNGNGYFFAFTMAGIETLFADRPELEGKNMLSVRGAQGEPVVADMIDILQKDREGFYRYTWSKPGQKGIHFEKIAFVKYFEPLDWGIGTGIYVDEMTEEIRNEVIQRVSQMHLEDQGYYFGSVAGGLPLFTDGKVTLGGPSIWEMTDINGVKIIQEQNRIARQPGGGFVQYHWPKPGYPEPVPKLSYVTFLPKWQWIIGSGMYMDEIEQTIESDRQALLNNTRDRGVIAVGVVFVGLLVIYLRSRNLTQRIQSGMDRFSGFFKKAVTKSVTIDPGLLPFNEFRVIAAGANELVEGKNQVIRELEISKKRYKEAQSLGKVGNWEYHLQTGRFWGSDEAKNIYGFDPDADFFTVDEVENCIPDRERVHQALEDLIERQEPYRLEFSIITRDTGQEKIISSIAELEKDTQGNPVRVTGVIQDITRQKTLEKQLVQAHKMEAVGTLSGGIAHEFNNILSVILGFSELAMIDIDENNPLYESIQEIKSASLRGREIVAQLLSFSRKSSEEKRVLDPAGAVRETLSFMKASLPSTVSFSTCIAPDVSPILANATQLHQVIINLCNNAVHAMVDETGTITFTLENVVLREPLSHAGQSIAPGDYVRLRISDTGSGIPDDMLDRVFDPFFTTKPVDKGSGMGLAVVHGIMKSHDGMIFIKSDGDHGTTCDCFFPAVQADVTEPQLQPKPLETGNETLLFVDDDTGILTLAREILQRLGYQVVTCATPESALETFKRDPEGFDLVITDMTMPNMTGDDLIRALRSIRKEIPTIISTGYSRRMNPEKANELGATGFIMKPYEIKDLAAVVRRVLDGGRSGTIS